MGKERKYSKEPVKLCLRSRKDGHQVIYLEIYIEGKRTYERLPDLVLVPETDQKSIRKNDATLKKAGVICRKRNRQLKKELPDNKYVQSQEAEALQLTLFNWGAEKDPPTPVEVNIDIDKTQGNAIYSSLLGVQNTLDNFQLDVKKDSLREVVYQAIKDAVEEHLTNEDKAQLENEEKLRAEGKPGTVLEAYQMATNRNTDAINKFNHNSDVIKSQYKNISDLLCELLGRANLFPYEKPKFKDESGHILLNSLYLYPWYCFKCFYSSKYVRGLFKTIAWSIWLISLGLLFFVARDNAILQKQQNINRYVHAYFSGNAEVTMELEGIDLMFSNQEIKPMPVKEYRKYMKVRKKAAKAQSIKQK